MSRRVNLKLNLSPRAHAGGPSRGADEGSQNQRMSSSSSLSSSPNSCVSSETDQGSDSPEAASMVLAACPRCLMYVMLAEADPRCPKCHNTVIVNFLHNVNTSKKTMKSTKK